MGFKYFMRLGSFDLEWHYFVIRTHSSSSFWNMLANVDVLTSLLSSSSNSALTVDGSPTVKAG